MEVAAVEAVVLVRAVMVVSALVAGWGMVLEALDWGHPLAAEPGSVHRLNPSRRHKR